MVSKAKFGVKVFPILWQPRKTTLSYLVHHKMADNVDVKEPPKVIRCYGIDERIPGILKEGCLFLNSSIKDG